jgi:hypothetical protein
MSLFTRAAATLAAASVVLAPSAFMPAHADTPPSLPHLDSFYKYGVTPPASSKPGDVLDSRAVTLQGVTASAAEQLLYRTQDQEGKPSETVTTVINPAGASKGIVAYLSYYDALGDQCDPSYTLQGGGDGAGSEALVINALVNAGFAVTVPDYEGEKLHWVAGRESGWNTLDAVRATERHLSADPTTTKVGLIGYSGGSIAGEWATELAPSYAPDVTLVGAALGGLPVDLAHNLKYIDGSKTWSGVIPAALVSLGRAFGVDFSQYESDYGKKVTHQVSSQCIGQFNGAYPGLKIADLLKPQYRDFLHIPAVANMLNQLIMGSVAGSPQVPMMLEVGNSDGVGDGVMISKDVAALAREYCDEHVAIHFKEATGADHTGAGTDFFLNGGVSYLAGLLAGAPAADDCATVPQGNSLAPIVPTSGPWGPTPQVLKPVSATLKGHSKGRKDVLVVTVKGAAKSVLKGATVKLFRAGHKKAIGHGKIAKNGKATVTVTDHNGRAVTRYHAVVAATASTKSATTKVFRLR